MVMDCPHLINDCKINREFLKTKKCQLIDKINTNNTNNYIGGISAPTTSNVSQSNDDIAVVSQSISSISNVSGNGLQKLWNSCCADECDAKNNWMCLKCGLILCGRYDRGHALQHFYTKNHKVCLSILDFSVYCYKCENFVVNLIPQLEEIRHYLSTEDDTKSETSSNTTEESGSLVSGYSSLKSSVLNISNASISSTDSGSWEEQSSQNEFCRRLRPRKRTKSNDVSVLKGDYISSGNKKRKVQRKSLKDSLSNESSLINSYNYNDMGKINSSPTKGAQTTSPKKSYRRFVGLRNLGNTCFMSSVLQSLNNIQEFSCYISSLPSLEKECVGTKQRVYHSRSMKENYDDAMVLKDLRRLIIDLSKGKTITPDYLLRWNFLQFDMNEPNDAHEFLRYMLDRLHTELLLHLPNSFESNEITSSSGNGGNTSASTSSSDIVFSAGSNINAKKNLSKQIVQDNENNGCENNCSTGVKTNLSSNVSNSTCTSNNNTGNDVNGNNNSNTIYNYKTPTNRSSIVTNVFGGILQNEVRCVICGMESKKHDPFLDLSLDIPEKFYSNCSSSSDYSSGSSKNSSVKEKRPVCNIKDCISSFMEVEELDVKELYYCSSCKCKQKSTKRFWIRRLPNVLCLHIKRFRWNTQRIPYEWSKIDLKISFPLKALDMSQFVLNNGTESRIKNNNSNIYDLGAVIVHHGQGKIAFGHYTSYAINNETWLHFNDHMVKEVPPSEVAECKPYMLFYIRRDSKNKNFTNPLATSSTVKIQSSLSSPISSTRDKQNSSSENNSKTKETSTEIINEDFGNVLSSTNLNLDDELSSKISETSAKTLIGDSKTNNINSTSNKTL